VFRKHFRKRLRKHLIDILLNQATSLYALSRLLEEKEKDLEADCRHLFKSLKNTDYNGVVIPSECRK